MGDVKVLCVSPRFPPSSAADGHRLRLLLPHLVRRGCSAEVLSVDPACASSPLDPWLTHGLPADVPVHRVKAWPLSGWGLNGLAQRSFVPLLRKGSQLLASRSFDLIFFSTTEFLLHPLGPVWQRRHGVPFCMDFQDPWVNDYYRQNPRVLPPGGRLKHSLADALHRVAERVVVPRCSGFIAVSEDYLGALDRRYGGRVAWQPRLVAPFPAEPAERAPASAQFAVRPGKPGLSWRYVGRGGPDMVFSASGFFGAWQMAIRAGVLTPDGASLDAIGTSYAARKEDLTFAPLARRFGLEHLVTESPGRIPYGDTLSALESSDALVIFGSDDATYTASKLYPYLLAERPLLAIFHERSSVASVLAECGGGITVSFSAAATEQELAQAIYERWFASGAFRQAGSLDMKAFSRYTASAQATQVMDWFRRVLSARGREPNHGEAE